MIANVASLDWYLGLNHHSHRKTKIVRRRIFRPVSKMESLFWERVTSSAELPPQELLPMNRFPYEEWLFIARHQPSLTFDGYQKLRQQAKIQPEQLIDPDDLEKTVGRFYRWYHYQRFNEISRALVQDVFGGEEGFIMAQEDPLVEPLIMYDTVMGNVTQVATVGQGIGMWMQGVDPDLYFMDNLRDYRPVAERLYQGQLPPPIKDQSYETFVDTARYYADVELLRLFVQDGHHPIFESRSELLTYCWNRFNEEKSRSS